MIKFSIIVPVLNEGPLIPRALSQLSTLAAKEEVIVIDGGSADDTVEQIRTAGIRIEKAARGRGCQCNAGARIARGDVLVFLHLDTRLPSDVLTFLRRKFGDDKVEAGRFRSRFDNTHPVLKFYSWFTRFEGPLTSFGDQCLAVRRDVFEKMGGFPEWPLLEDVHFFRQLRKKQRIEVFPRNVLTSARRYQENGVVRQQWRNGIILLKYLLGVAPNKMAKVYESAKAGRYAG